MNKIIHMVAAPAGLWAVFADEEKQPVLCIALMEDICTGERYLNYMVGFPEIVEAHVWGDFTGVEVRG